MAETTTSSQDRWVRTGSVLQQQAAIQVARLIEGLEHSQVFFMGGAEIRILINSKGEGVADSTVLSRGRPERTERVERVERM